MALPTILLLTLALSIGLFLVFLGMHYKKSSLKLGLLHASLAIAGMVFLFTQIFRGPTDKLNNIAALFFLLALIGGGMVFALREADKPPVMPVVTIHAIMALIGFSLLVYNYFGVQ